MKTIIIRDEDKSFMDCTELINSIYLHSFSISVIEGMLEKNCIINGCKIFIPNKIHNINVDGTTKFNTAIWLVDYIGYALCILTSISDADIIPIFNNLYISNYEALDAPNFDIYSQFVTHYDYNLIYFNEGSDNKVTILKSKNLENYVEFHNKFSSYFVLDNEYETYYYEKLTMSTNNTNFVKYEEYNTIMKGEF